MSALKGDFISFSFNGVHSSELGIIRTSDGSRFNENLLPTIQDKTVQVPGGDGTYFFGSYYTQKPFNIPIAFDSLTEEQVRRLYSHFGDKQIHKLIFDERPYKYYMAKINGTPQIKTICFEVEGERIYKGEGTLNFICYYPFAKSRFKYLDEYFGEDKYEKWNYNENEWDDKKNKLYILQNEKYVLNTSSIYNEEEDYYELIPASIPEWKNWPGTTSEGDLYSPGIADTTAHGNLNEWKLASRMKQSSSGYDTFISTNSSSTANLFNAGDFPADFRLIYESTDINNLIKINNSKDTLCFDFSKVEEIKIEDKYIQINTSSQLIEGLDEDYKSTGNVYNVAVKEGEFFKIPEGESFLVSVGVKPTKIEYEYIYF